MDIPTQDELVDKIDAFLLRHDMAETRFGRETVNNPAFLRGLRAGSPPKLDTLIKLQSYMERKDAALRLNPPPLELTSPPGDEEEVPLPFSAAPVSPTGGCSPTYSSTIERATTPPANGSCRCSAEDGQAASPNPSCSADIDTVLPSPQRVEHASPAVDAGTGDEGRQGASPTSIPTQAARPGECASEGED